MLGSCVVSQDVASFFFISMCNYFTAASTFNLFIKEMFRKMQEFRVKKNCCKKKTPQQNSNLGFQEICKIKYKTKLRVFQGNSTYQKTQVRESQTYPFPSTSSHQRCSVNIEVAQNFAIFTGKYLCWSLFLIKLQD